MLLLTVIAVYGSVYKFNTSELLPLIHIPRHQQSLQNGCTPPVLFLRFHQADCIITREKSSLLKSHDLTLRKCRQTFIVKICQGLLNLLIELEKIINADKQIFLQLKTRIESAQIFKDNVQTVTV